jgi:hypothetical protein
MPLEQATFWYRWSDAAIPIGTSDIDIALPEGRNIALEGWGGYREDTSLIFQLGVVWTSGTFKILVPTQWQAADNWTTLSTVNTYTDFFNEIPMSTWQGCDVQAIRIRVNNGGAGVKYAAGHVRGRYLG